MQGCQWYEVKRIKPYFREYGELWIKVWGKLFISTTVVVLISSKTPILGNLLKTTNICLKKAFENISVIFKNFQINFKVFKNYLLLLGIQCFIINEPPFCTFSVWPGFILLISPSTITLRSTILGAVLLSSPHLLLIIVGSTSKFGRKLDQIPVKTFF